jgi:hypothetical protein
MCAEADEASAYVFLRGALGKAGFLWKIGCWSLTVIKETAYGIFGH